MNYEKYLPVGTVVMLKGGKKRAMITGFCSMATEDKTKIYDYSGCLYPEGILKSDQTLLFNHEQIDKIYHLGLVDEEEKEFKQKLKEVISKMNTTIEKGLNVNNTTNTNTNNINYSIDNSGNNIPNLTVTPTNNIKDTTNVNNNLENNEINNNMNNGASFNFDSLRDN